VLVTARLLALTRKPARVPGHQLRIEQSLSRRTTIPVKPHGSKPKREAHLCGAACDSKNADMNRHRRMNRN